MRHIVACSIVALSIICTTCTVMFENGSMSEEVINPSDQCVRIIQYSYNGKIWHNCIKSIDEVDEEIKHHIPNDANHLRINKKYKGRTTYIPLSLGR